MPAPALAIPTIHLNGTSREALVTGLCDAIDAIHAAGKKLAEAAPNTRDYYPQGAAVVAAMMLQHDARMAQLRAVATELETIVREIGG